MTRVQLVIASCQRCGKPVTTAARSLYGLDDLKARFGVLCQTCVTPEELYRINMEIGARMQQALQRRHRRR